MRKIVSYKVTMVSTTLHSLTIFFIAGIAPVGVLIKHCEDGVPTPTNQ